MRKKDWFSYARLPFHPSYYPSIPLPPFLPPSICQSVTLAGLIYLRVRDPDRPRPIRMPLFLSVIVFLFCIVILVVIIYNDSSTTLFLIVGVVSGTIFYVVMMRAQR